MRVLVTGAAGFIGFHTARALLDRRDEVTGLDNLNSYYDPRLKQARLDILRRARSFDFVRADLEDEVAIAALFADGSFDRVVHLAAQAGVRYSMKDPRSFAASNLVGTLTVLEGCRRHAVEHLVLGSSSSLYGKTAERPSAVCRPADHPLSVYAATKRGAELLAHSYASLYGLPVTGLRFFTVYGPFGRPDMALFRFTKKILAGEAIDLYNAGRHRRDFTYITDIVDGIVRTLDRPATADSAWNPETPHPGSSDAPFRLYNLGSGRPVELLRLVEVLETSLGRKASRNLLPLQPGDVVDTWADTSAFHRAFGFLPKTAFEDGVRRFLDWYLDFYGVEP